MLVIGSEKDPVSLSEFEKAIDHYRSVDEFEIHLRFDNIFAVYDGVLTRKRIDPKFLH